MKFGHRPEPHYFLTPAGRTRLNAQLAIVLKKVMRYRMKRDKLGRPRKIRRNPRPINDWGVWRAAAHVRGRPLGYFRWMLCEPCKSVPTRKVRELVILANHGMKDTDKNYLSWQTLIDWSRVVTR